MNPAAIEKLDPFSAPLQGTNLIEASAGTGKTYTITTLFIRLILEKNLTVDKILVVTFTEAATEFSRITRTQSGSQSSEFSFNQCLARL